MTAPTFCAVRDVARRYGDVVALSDVSLDLFAGEVFGLAGPNGAGKSTLARVVAGFLAPTTGTTRIDGLDPPANRETRGVGYLPEEADRPSGFTVAGFLAGRCLPAGRPLHEERVIQLLGLEPLRDRKLAQLSKGQWRMALIGYASLGPSPLIILDEPDSGLDPNALDRLVRLIEVCSAEGATVVILSHLLELMERCCDRVALIDGGRVLSVLARPELGSRDIRQIYREIMGS